MAAEGVSSFKTVFLPKPIKQSRLLGCMAKGLICDNPAWPLYAGWVINLALVVGTGPVAWRLGGRYRALFVTPLLVVPVYVVAIPVMGVAYLALCTIS